MTTENTPNYIPVETAGDMSGRDANSIVAYYAKRQRAFVAMVDVLHEALHEGHWTFDPGETEDNRAYLDGTGPVFDGDWTEFLDTMKAVAYTTHPRFAYYPDHADTPKGR